VGINAIFVFVCSGLLAIALSRNHVTPSPAEQRVMQFLWDAGESQTHSRIVQNLANSKFSAPQATSAIDRLTKRHWLSVKRESGADFYSARIKPEDARVTLHGWLYSTLWTSWVH